MPRLPLLSSLLPPKRYRLLKLATVISLIFIITQTYLWLASSGHLARFKRRITPDFQLQIAPITKLQSTPDLNYTAAVIYLVNESRFRDLIISLNYLFKNVAMHPWPILFFHETNLADQALQTEFILRLYDALGGSQAARWFIERIEWIPVNLSLPDNISHKKAVLRPIFDNVWPGYHLMCGFFAAQIFQHARLANVTYYMRMDTDSFIYRPLCYDPIDLFHQHNRSYAYRSTWTDPSYVVQGMWDLVDEYARSNPAIESQLAQNEFSWPDNRNRKAFGMADFPTYYNNWEIVKLDAFRRPDVKKWLDDLMSVPERVYKYRWGDAPIRYATVQMFFDFKKDVEVYCGMDYLHNWVQEPHCSCKEQIRQL